MQGMNKGIFNFKLICLNDSKYKLINMISIFILTFNNQVVSWIFINGIVINETFFSSCIRHDTMNYD